MNIKVKVSTQVLEDVVQDLTYERDKMEKYLNPGTIEFLEKAMSSIITKAEKHTVEIDEMQPIIDSYNLKKDVVHTTEGKELFEEVNIEAM